MPVISRTLKSSCPSVDMESLDREAQGTEGQRDKEACRGPEWWTARKTETQGDRPGVKGPPPTPGSPQPYSRRHLAPKSPGSKYIFLWTSAHLQAAPRTPGTRELELRDFDGPSSTEPHPAPRPQLLGLGDFSPAPPQFPDPLHQGIPMKMEVSLCRRGLKKPGAWWCRTGVKSQVLDQAGWHTGQVTLSNSPMGLSKLTQQVG